MCSQAESLNNRQEGKDTNSILGKQADKHTEYLSVRVTTFMKGFTRKGDTTCHKYSQVSEYLLGRRSLFVVSFLPHTPICVPSCSWIANQCVFVYYAVFVCTPF